MCPAAPPGAGQPGRDSKEWRSGCRRGRWKASTALSPPTLLENHHRQRLDHDPDILGQRLALDVLEVVPDLVPDVVDAHVVRVVDLRPARDSRLRELAQRILGN